MGKYNFSALRVRQSAINQKATGKIKKLPEWVDVLGDIPPSQVLVRNLPQEHFLFRQRLETGKKSSQPVPVIRRTSTKSKKASRMFQPMPIKFEEDGLRAKFFKDHPWELARPRILVETSGKDSERYDWSRIEQPGKRVDGESVVQRQLWLLNNVPDMKPGVAYDIARREFYRLRHREDIERRVAAEEAEATGAVFGPSRLQIGMELESQEFERWKQWAQGAAQEQLQKDAAYVGVPEAESSLDSEMDEIDESSEHQV